MEILAIVKACESAGIALVGLAAAFLLGRNANRLHNAKRTLRYLEALICFLLALTYGAQLFGLIDPGTLSLYVRPLLIMLLLALFGREWLERVP